MAVRKSVPVALIVEKANYFLANSEDSKQDKRRATANFVETLLLNERVNAYAGFSYLPSAGMVRGEDGYAIDFADETRRHYNLHHRAR